MQRSKNRYRLLLLLSLEKKTACYKLLCVWNLLLESIVAWLTTSKLRAGTTIATYIRSVGLFVRFDILCDTNGSEAKPGAKETNKNQDEWQMILLAGTRLPCLTIFFFLHKWKFVVWHFILSVPGEFPICSHHPPGFGCGAFPAVECTHLNDKVEHL